ncbi:MAG: hypothetical protein LUD17_05030 [Bacteroidales bacterium]|nr:hypothetical protein [Bacteroidales bacterium]
MEEQIKALQEQIESLTNEVAQRDSQIADLSGEIENLKTKLEAANKQTDFYRDSWHEAYTERDELKEQIKAFALILGGICK